MQTHLSVVHRESKELLAAVVHSASVPISPSAPSSGGTADAHTAAVDHTAGALSLASNMVSSKDGH